MSRSEEREEELRLLLLVLSEEERLSVFPPETLLRLELLLRLGPEVLLLRPDLDVPLPPDESVHCADGRKNSGGNEPNQNPNDDKNGKISALLPDTE